MDVMTTDENSAKESIYEALNLLKSLNYSRPNSFLLRIFMDAKSDEITEVFSGGTPFKDAKSIKNMLQRISPTNSDKWDKIK